MLNNTFKERLISVLEYSSKDPISAADEIEKRYGDERALLAADIDELCDISALSEQGAYLLRLCFAISSRRVTDRFRFGRLHTEEEILDYFKALFLSKTNESVYCMLFDEQNRAISCEFVTEGTINSTGVLPRKMLELAVKKKAKSLIVAHNHPGGHATASIDDINSTSTLLKMFSASGKNLLGHYIIAGDEHYKIETQNIRES